MNREQVFLFQQRGIWAEKAVPAILTGFCDAVLRELPHEFESEAREMVAMKIEEFLEGSPLLVKTVGDDARKEEEKKKNSGPFFKGLV
jgi:hypothetical protein